MVEVGSRAAWALGAVALLAATPGLMATPAAATPAAATTSVQGNGGVGPNIAFGSPQAATPKVAFNPVRGLDIPAMAVDPADPSHIVLVDENFLTSQCEYHVTFDAGRTWAGGPLTTPADFAQPPCHTFDSGGYAHFDQSVVFGSGQNVYTTFASHRGAQERPEIHVVQGQGDSVMVAHSTDGGRTFGTAAVAIQGGPGPQPYVIRPGIAVQAQAGRPDKLYAIGWQVFVTSGGASAGGGERSLITASSADGGQTWSAPVLASAPADKVREPTQPVVAADGTVYVGWRDRNDAPAVNHIVVARSSDGGATWTASQAGVAAAPGVKSGGGFPRLAVDPRSGALYLVYQGATSAGTNISFQRSMDHGTTWSSPITVNDDPPGTGVPHDTPQVFVAPGGRVDVVWLDLRNSYPTPTSAKASGQGDIYYASSSDGGLSFSANRRITDRTIDMNAGLIGRIGSYTWYGPAEAAMGSGRLLLAWGDPRLGDVDTDTQDLYLAHVDLAASGAAPVTTMPTMSASDLSVALSTLAYPGGAEEIGGQAQSKVVLVGESDSASALAGAVLARASSGPLLASPAAGLTKALRDEVSRFKPSGAYLVGGQSQLSPQVATDLRAAGVKGSIVRLAGATPSDTAAAVAAAVEAGGPESRFSKGPTVNPAAVIVNPASPEAGAGAAMAAARRYPVLFAGANVVPGATLAALSSLGIRSTLVVGGTSVIDDAAMSHLPSARRLSGADASATSASVVRQSLAMGLPTNVVYVTDLNAPMDGPLVGAAAARLGGLVVLNAGGDAAAAATTIDQLHLGPHVDRMVVARSPASGTSTVLWVLIGVFILLGLIGVALLAVQRARSRRPAQS